MRYPKIPGRKVYVETLARFGGLDRQARPGAGSFTHMENLSARDWPLITPRPRRGVYAKPASPQGLIGGDVLCYVDGADFVIGEQRIPMGLSVRPEDCPKQLRAMGTKVIILPDGKYIDTLDPEQRGDLEAIFRGSGVPAELCREDGTVLEAVTVGETAPETGLWLDTGGEAPVLREWSESQGQWGERGCFVRLSKSGIGAGFFPEDTVRVTGCGGLDGLRRVARVTEDALVLERTDGVLTVRILYCPAVRHLRKTGRDVSAWFRLSTEVVMDTFASAGNVVFTMVSYDEETGAAEYRFEQ